MAAIHVLLPPAMHSQLAFRYQYPAVLSVFTSAFVHHSTSHLVTNLIGYGLAAGMTYLLSREAGQRRWFRRTVVVLVVMVPFLVTSTSYLVLTSLQPGLMGAERGFSGVAAGFVGFLFVALLIWLERRYSRVVTWSVGPMVFIGLLLEIAVIYTSGVPVTIIGLGLVGIALSGWQLVDEVALPVGAAFRLEVVPEGLFVGLVVVLLGLLVLLLFPVDIVQQGTTTNIISHGAGFVSGIVLSGICWLIR
ncbi:hypothetical protein [Haloarcula nitratireducens]|uniref:Rhomboid family intramembrane serine protease n=1 Tax=Haloarcula nitratireducens TaxID=2487749 RepID=A0AAW4PGX5_9EURY|nr:hypothetical protein [Halomicroarcula nitratireducens]MBX0296992.1 hypothetical protein [Halomicroarcula nitratireducens]